ncbi:hypothetical protein ACIQ7D_12640 [Streptomyces sp. NPDC096310]|uniref:hypothetical protein n=1 Tax=Streptomyces sp. NPDC096310 TaxID=3366082 RepID=UPI00381B7121
MTNSSSDRDDADRVLIRSKWGTSRYVYNPRNPVGRALIVGSLLFAAGGMFLLHHPDLLSPSDDWDGDELRTAVTTAAAELSREAQFGPGGAALTYDDILRGRIARAGQGSEDGLTVALASDRPKSALYDGGPEQADYTVTAAGTDAAFCLSVHAMKTKRAMGYDYVSISVDDSACPAS